MNCFDNCFFGKSYYTFIFIKPIQDFSFNETLMNAEFGSINDFINYMKYTDFYLYEHQIMKKYIRNFSEFEEYQTNADTRETFNEIISYIERNNSTIYRHTFKDYLYKYMDQLIQNVEELGEYTTMIAIKVYEWSNNKCLIKYLANYRKIYNELIDEYNLYNNNELVRNDLNMNNFIKLVNYYNPTDKNIPERYFVERYTKYIKALQLL
jgi:hypothetical protein